ncbi:hypothetical protein GCM10010261_41440 [Streptomyces pilosus]|nr:hypothetical protein GCM10010261_41440 [Streptomyces pilosus]
MPGQPQQGLYEVELPVHHGGLQLPGRAPELVPAHPQTGHDLVPRTVRSGYVGSLPAGTQRRLPTLTAQLLSKVTGFLPREHPPVPMDVG